MLANLTPSQLAEEVEDARSLIAFWRDGTRQAIRTYNAAFCRSDTDERADMQDDIRFAFRRYRRYQARLRILTTAPELRFFHLAMEADRVAA